MTSEQNLEPIPSSDRPVSTTNAQVHPTPVMDSPITVSKVVALLKATKNASQEKKSVLTDESIGDDNGPEDSSTWDYEPLSWSESPDQSSSLNARSDQPVAGALKWITQQAQNGQAFLRGLTPITESDSEDSEAEKPTKKTKITQKVMMIEYEVPSVMLEMTRTIKLLFNEPWMIHEKYLAVTINSDPTTTSLNTCIGWKLNMAPATKGGEAVLPAELLNKDDFEKMVTAVQKSVVAEKAKKERWEKSKKTGKEPEVHHTVVQIFLSEKPDKKAKSSGPNPSCATSQEPNPDRAPPGRQASGDSQTTFLQQLFTQALRLGDMVLDLLQQYQDSLVVVKLQVYYSAPMQMMPPHPMLSLFNPFSMLSAPNPILGGGSTLATSLDLGLAPTDDTPIGDFLKALDSDNHGHGGQNWTQYTQAFLNARHFSLSSLTNQKHITMKYIAKITQMPTGYTITFLTFVEQEVDAKKHKHLMKWMMAAAQLGSFGRPVFSGSQ
ncbi:hypothetical protein FRB99_002630 [Tulasnella sp. 403]|nr:hypothetical protein FRB99_002630 [Tulasnella sp. 403]